MLCRLLQLQELFNSQEAQYGGWEGSGNRGSGLIQATDDRIYIRLPKLAVLVFAQVRPPHASGPNAPSITVHALI